VELLGDYFGLPLAPSQKRINKKASGGEGLYQSANASMYRTLRRLLGRGLFARGPSASTYLLTECGLALAQRLGESYATIPARGPGLKGRLASKLEKPASPAAFSVGRSQLSRLQRSILGAALLGAKKQKQRALLKEEKLASMWEGLGGSPGLIRIEASKIGHLDRKQILAGYFDLTLWGAPTLGRERKLRYARANASLCRALRRLRARGLIEQALDNSSIRLTPKGRKVARRLTKIGAG
jgi:DNA-binding PadR family transcriptional regulator